MVGNISTIAGNGVIGFSGDNRPAITAQFNDATGIDLDVTRQRVYIADSGNNRIRLIKQSTGIISTVAGNGAARYTGDSGPATLASLDNPSDVALDPLYNLLYIADTNNDVIRMVNISTGIITTVAGMGMRGYSGDGGQATSAYLSNPNSVAFDSSSRTLYISDSGNCAIRSLSVASGIISTLVTAAYCAGYSSNYDNYNYYATGGVAVNPTIGAVYYSLTYLNTIQMVDVSTKIVSLVAGSNSSSGYRGDGGLGKKALLNNPTFIAVHATTGNIYISDVISSAIRMITKSSGIITTVAGTGVAGYSGDGGLATQAQLYYPSGVAVDSSTGKLYIADTDNNIIRAVEGIVSSPRTVPIPPSESALTLFGSLFYFISSAHSHLSTCSFKDLKSCLSTCPSVRSTLSVALYVYVYVYVYPSFGLLLVPLYFNL